MARKKNKGTGRMMYVPVPVIKELKDIMDNKKIKKPNAFIEMASYAKVGREAERLMVRLGIRRRK